MRILSIFGFCAFFRGFLLLTFVRGISKSRHQPIWNQHKILRFFDTHIDIFQENFFWGHSSTFCNLKMQMRKKLYIFKHFAKSKNLFFCQYLSFSVWFLLKFQKSIKWSPLMCTEQNRYYNCKTQERKHLSEFSKHLIQLPNCPLKIVCYENWVGSGRLQMLGVGIGLWRSRLIFLHVVFSCCLIRFCSQSTSKRQFLYQYQ
jgi:hypothetical protein